MDYELCKARGINRAEEQKDTFQLRRRLQLGVVDGQLGTKRQIDVDNLARASFEHQIPCRKISNFPRKRGVPSGVRRGRGKREKGRQAVEQFHAFVDVRDRQIYMRK